MKSIFLSNHFSFIMLVLLSFVGVWLSRLEHSSLILQFIITLSVVIKGQQIVDIFMELLKAPAKWRWILLSYVIIVPTILFLISILAS